MPRAHMSTLESGSYMLITSGAWYKGVVLNPNVVWVCLTVSKSYLEIPKSPMQRSFFPSASSTMNILAGFKSLWKIFLLCKKSSPRSIIAKYSNASSSVNFAFVFINLSKSPPDANLVTMQCYSYWYVNSSMY